MCNYILPGCERSKNYKPLLKTGIEIIQGLTKLTTLLLAGLKETHTKTARKQLL